MDFDIWFYTSFFAAISIGWMLFSWTSRRLLDLRLAGHKDILLVESELLRMIHDAPKSATQESQQRLNSLYSLTGKHGLACRIITYRIFRWRRSMILGWFFFIGFGFGNSFVLRAGMEQMVEMGWISTQLLTRLQLSLGVLVTCSTYVVCSWIVYYVEGRFLQAYRHALMNLGKKWYAADEALVHGSAGSPL